MNCLRNVWYQAAWPDEVRREQTFSRTILDQKILMFRDGQGVARALLDRCPHRFAPLSAGRLADGIVTCGYHGLAFDGTGRCVHNPHGAIGAMRAEALPLVEKHQALWIWLGDPELADPAAIPNLKFIDDTPAIARVAGYMPTAANYQLVVDNILDLSHADFLHPTSLGGMFAAAKSRAKAVGNAVVVDYAADDCDPSPAFYGIVAPPQKADIRVRVEWFPAGVMILTAGANVHGTPTDHVHDSITLHSITPESPTTSHYFYCSTRQYATADKEMSAQLKAALDVAFAQEDKPMLELQQANIGNVDLQSLGPKSLPSDSAVIQVRRLLAKLVQNEQAAATADIPAAGSAALEVPRAGRGRKSAASRA